MNGSFRMIVAAALSLILSIFTARSQAASVQVVGQRWPASASRIDLVMIDVIGPCGSCGPELAVQRDDEITTRISGGGISGGLQTQTDATAVKYTGSQLSAALLTWAGDEVTANNTFSGDSNSDSGISLRQGVKQPFFSLVNEVPAPLAQWQISAGLLVMLVGVFRARRPRAAARVTH